MEGKIYLALSDPKDPPPDCFYTIPAGEVLYLSKRKEVEQKRENIFKRLRHSCFVRLHVLRKTKENQNTLF